MSSSFTVNQETDSHPSINILNIQLKAKNHIQINLTFSMVYMTCK